MADTPKENRDGLAAFPDGINSGIDPTLLPQTQLAYATNTTMRGTFLNSRPEFPNRTLTFSSTIVQSNFQTGLWQGACYYKPVTGNEQLIASIGGRLFAVDIVTFSVTDISIVNDLNPSTITQAWLWQSERWVVVQDGISVPIFYDGVFSRRAVQLTEYGVIDGDWPIGGDGLPDPANVVSPGYTGPFGASVLIGTTLGTQEIFQVQPGVVGPSASFQVTLTSVNDSIGATYPTGTNFIFNPNFPGVIAITSSFMGTSGTFDIYFVSAFPGAVGNGIVVNGVVVTVTAISVDKKTVTVRITPIFPESSGTPLTQTVTATAGDVITFSGPTQPTAIAFTTIAPFPAIASGSSATIDLSAPYLGVSGASVWVGTKAYIAVAVPVVSSPTTISLVNNNGANLIVKTGSTIFSVPELPPGRMGCYGMGRNWQSLTDGVSYVASDLVGGPSGSAIYDYRDSVLKMVENVFLSGGGSFSIPVSGDQITAMRFCANLDLALGQGPLQIFVQSGAFSCNAPVDRDTWETLTNPIQTQSLINNGSMSHYATVLANSDILFRSPDGFRSFLLARRDFNTHGNVPISREIIRLIQADTISLLAFESAIVFDNRYLTTVRPVQGSNGVYHTALAVMNFDPVSTLRGKLPPIWEGEWTGLNAYQIILANVSLVERAFAFHKNLTTGVTELYEILKSADSREAISEWSFESPSIFGSQPERRQFQRLMNGEMWVDMVDGPLTFKIYFRADDSLNWTLWHQWSEATDTGAFKPRMGLGIPNAQVCDEETGRTVTDGYEFFIKVVITGKCQWKGARFLSTNQSEPKYKMPKCQ